MKRKNHAIFGSFGQFDWKTYFFLKKPPFLLPNPGESDILVKHDPQTGGITLAHTDTRSQRRASGSPSHSSRSGHSEYPSRGRTRPSGGRRVQPTRRSVKRRRHSIWFRLYMVLVVISAIIVATYIGLHLAIRAPEIPQTEPDPPPASGSQAEQPAAPPEDPNALVRKEGVYTFALLGKDVKGSNTDTIILARYDTVAQTVGMVSIPRDTAVHRTWSKYSKINAAFYGSSPETLKEEIQNTFGIPVDYYILVDPKGFIALVDELDGVDVYIPEDMNYDDPTPGEELHIHYQTGTHHLNGKQALEVARFRHNNDGSGYTDTGRAEMHRQMLVALAKKVVSWNSIPKVTAFVELFQTYVKTDLSPSDMLFFATQAMGVDFSSGITQGELTGRGDGVVGNSKWCYVFQPEDILPTLNEQLNPYTRDLTADDLDLPQPDRYLQNY